ncbi:MAG: hypothetical protein AAF805_00155 [Planctomycetota bacterium]
MDHENPSAGDPGGDPGAEPTPDDDRRYTDRRGLAAMTGLSIGQVDKVRDELGDEHEERLPSGQLRFYLPGWLRQWALREANKTNRPAAERPKRPEIIDRQRLLRILKERDEWLERRGRLVDVERVEEVVSLFGALFKQRADGMCGECRGTFEATLADFDERLEEEFPTDGGLGDEERAFLESIARDLRAASLAVDAGERQPGDAEP